MASHHSWQIEKVWEKYTTNKEMQLWRCGTCKCVKRQVRESGKMMFDTSYQSAEGGMFSPYMPSCEMKRAVIAPNKSDAQLVDAIEKVAAGDRHIGERGNVLVVSEGVTGKIVRKYVKKNRAEKAPKVVVEGKKRIIHHKYISTVEEEFPDEAYKFRITKTCECGVINITMFRNKGDKKHGNFFFYHPSNLKKRLYSSPSCASNPQPEVERKHPIQDVVNSLKYTTKETERKDVVTFINEEAEIKDREWKSSDVKIKVMGVDIKDVKPITAADMDLLSTKHERVC